MRIALLAAAVALSAGGAALADQTARAPTTEAQPRVVYVCDTSAATRRSWVLEHGSIAFVTAEDLRRAEATKETWTAPRCITAGELNRYRRSEPAKLVRASN